MQAKRIAFLIVLCSLFISIPCLAHKVRVFAWGEGDTIHTESKFSRGKPAQNATITVFNTSTGDEILQGKSNQQGLFQFPAPDSSVEEINIVVNSGDGHKNNWLYQLGSPDKLTSDSPKIDNPPPTKTTGNSPAVTLTKEQFTQIINEALEKKLAPIRRQLAEESDQKPDVKDILGGIGYILGLAGIAAYMKSKKQ
ncbi:hypothetical protein [Desulforhopalus sp. 52FAK]